MYLQDYTSYLSTCIYLVKGSVYLVTLLECAEKRESILGNVLVLPLLAALMMCREFWHSYSLYSSKSATVWPGHPSTTGRTQPKQIQIIYYLTNQEISLWEKYNVNAAHFETRWKYVAKSLTVSILPSDTHTNTHKKDVKSYDHYKRLWLPALQYTQSQQSLVYCCVLLVVFVLCFGNSVILYITILTNLFILSELP